MSENDLSSKRVFVIGGETALGRAVLIGLAEAGADIAVASLTSDTKAEFGINSALNELWALGRKGVALAIDASDAEMLRRAAEQAESELGALDLVVTPDAGVAGEALDGREVFVVPPDAGADEALRDIKKLLQQG